MFFCHFQFQIYYDDAIEVVMEKLQPDDIDEKFMQYNGISEMCGARCRTDLEQYVGNVPVAVKGALDNFFMTNIM